MSRPEALRGQSSRRVIAGNAKGGLLVLCEIDDELALLVGAKLDRLAVGETRRASRPNVVAPGRELKGRRRTTSLSVDLYASEGKHHYTQRGFAARRLSICRMSNGVCDGLRARTGL